MKVLSRPLSLMQKNKITLAVMMCGKPLQNKEK